MTQTTQRFRNALEARDADAAAALLAGDVAFRSPVVFKPNHGREAVRGILAAVFRVFDDWRCVREIGAPEGHDHAIVFQAHIGDRHVEGCDFLHFDADGSIDEFYVMVRAHQGRGRGGRRSPEALSRAVPRGRRLRRPAHA